MTELNKSPAFQFYPKDFLTDGKVITMPYAVRGMYITLLSIDWIEDGFTESQFNQICSFAKNEFQGSSGYDTAIAQLLPCFSKHPTKDGYLTNPRLQKERKAQAERRADRSGAGKLGAEKRWNNNKNNKLTNDSTAIDVPMAKHASSSSSSSSNNNINIGDGLIKVGVHTYLTQYSKDLIKKRFLDEGLGNKDIKRAIEYLDKDFEVNAEKRYPIRDHRLDLIGWPLDKVRTVKADLDKKKPTEKPKSTSVAYAESPHPAVRAQRERDAKEALEKLGMGGLVK